MVDEVGPEGANTLFVAKVIRGPDFAQLSAACKLTFEIVYYE